MKGESRRAYFALWLDDLGSHCRGGLEIVGWRGRCLLQDDLQDGGILSVDGLRDEGILWEDGQGRSHHDGTFLSWVYLHGETFLS